MKLSAYLDLTKQSQRTFASKIGCTPATISYIIKGQRRPSPDLAEQIEKATDGAVGILELLYPKKSVKK